MSYAGPPPPLQQGPFDGPPPPAAFLRLQPVDVVLNACIQFSDYNDDLPALRRRARAPQPAARRRLSLAHNLKWEAGTSCSPRTDRPTGIAMGTDMGTAGMGTVGGTPKTMGKWGGGEDDGEGGDGEGGEKRRHECTKCGKKFNRPSSLKIHLNTHTGAKRESSSFFKNSLKSPSPKFVLSTCTFFFTSISSYVLLSVHAHRRS